MGRKHKARLHELTLSQSLEHHKSESEVSSSEPQSPQSQRSSIFQTPLSRNARSRSISNPSTLLTQISIAEGTGASPVKPNSAFMIMIQTLDTLSSAEKCSMNQDKAASSTAPKSETDKMRQPDFGKPPRTSAHPCTVNNKVDVLSPGWFSQQIKNVSDGNSSLDISSPLFPRYSRSWI